MATYDEMIRGDKALREMRVQEWLTEFASMVVDMQRESQDDGTQDHPGRVSVEPEGSRSKFKKKFKDGVRVHEGTCPAWRRQPCTCEGSKYEDFLSEEAGVRVELLFHRFRQGVRTSTAGVEVA